MPRRQAEEILGLLEEQGREDERLEEHVRAVAALRDAELDAELRRFGVDPGEAEQEARDLLPAGRGAEVREAGHTAAEPVPAVPQVAMPRRPRQPSRRRTVVVWLAVAAAAATAGGAALYATLHDTPVPEAVQAPPATPPAPTETPELLAAAELRRRAAAECDAGRWAQCLARLDEAKDMDPAGDSTPEIARMRARMAKEMPEKK